MARSRGTLLDPLEEETAQSERERERRKITKTVTVCAPEEEAGVGRLAGREECDAQLFGGFSFVYGAAL